MSSVLVGIDAGMTKTVAAVAAPGGPILGVGRRGGGSIYGRQGAEGALGNIRAALDEALSHAAASPRSIAVLVLSAAGADWAEDCSLLAERLGGMLPGTRVRVENDGLGGLWAGSPDGTGLALVMGTGCAVAARAPDGRQWHGGFWVRKVQPGDLSRAALDAVVWSELGVAPPTTLTGRVLAAVGARTVEELLEATTRRRGSVPLPVGAVAAALLDAAGDGDGTAAGILRAGAHDAALNLLAAAARTGLRGDTWLVGAGGMFRHRRMADWLVDVAAEVAGELPGLRPVVATRQPVVGALRLANWLSGTLGASTDEALDASHPGDELFVTLARSNSTERTGRT